VSKVSCVLTAPPACDRHETQSTTGFTAYVLTRYSIQYNSPPLGPSCISSITS
jgi:hypothetical protein